MEKEGNKKRILYSEIVGSRKNYNMCWIDEYKMMREEIVNHMDKQQTLRDMLYVAMAACIVFAFSDDVPFLAMLLPLLFILPAYACASNYWICVRKASAYLVVFHECYVDCPFHWEIRHGLCEKYNPKVEKETFQRSTFFNIYIQLSLYYMFAFVTMILYIIRLYTQIVESIAVDPSVFWLEVRIDGFPVWFYIMAGISMIGVMIFAFVKLSMGPSYQEFLERFHQAREQEENELKNKGMNIEY